MISGPSFHHKHFYGTQGRFETTEKVRLNESGRLLIIFLIGSIGTVAGAIVGFFLLKDVIMDLDLISAMMTGSYIGGGINFAAMAA